MIDWNVFWREVVRNSIPDIIIIWAGLTACRWYWGRESEIREWHKALLNCPDGCLCIGVERRR